MSITLIKYISRINHYFLWPRKEKKLFFIGLCFFLYYLIRVKLLGNSKIKLKKHLGSPSSLVLSNTQLTPSLSSIRSIRLTLNRLMMLLPIKNMCLICALTGRRLLQKENLGKGELYLGIRQDFDAQSGWITHVWLTCGSHDLVGCKGKNTYGILGLFQDTI